MKAYKKIPKGFLSRYMVAVVMAIMLHICGMASGRADSYIINADSVFNYGRDLLIRDNDYNHSLEVLHGFLRMTDDNPGDKERERMLANLYIGSICMMHGDYTSSSHYYLQSLILAEKLRDSKVVYQSYYNLSETYRNLGDYRKARSYNRKMRGVEYGPDYMREIAYLTNEGNIMTMTGDWDAAFISWMMAWDMIEKNDPSDINRFFLPMHLSDYYETHRNNLDSALRYSGMAYARASADNYVYYQTESAKRLMCLYTRKGDIENALKFQRIYFSLSDSAISAEGFMKIRTTQQHLQHIKYMQEMDLMVQKIRMHRIILALVVVVCLLAFAICVMLWKRKKDTDQTNRTLYLQNHKLMAAEEALGETTLTQLPLIGTAADFSDKSDVSPENDNEKDRHLLGRILDVVGDPENFSRTEFGLSAISERVGANSKYISELVNRCLGKSVPMLINEFRVKEARRRISRQDKYGNLTLESIAAGVGYVSQATFNRNFKLITGMTPSSYRKMVIKERNGRIEGK